MRTKEIQYIVIHCTGTLPSAKPSAIMSYWKNSLGWKSPGYHILIDVDGVAHVLLDFEKISNGVAGKNSVSIHISYIGGLDSLGFFKDTRTPAQNATILESIRKAMAWVKKRQQTVPQIVGHHDLDNKKACPCFNAKREYSWITV